jgi:hypothetical protein
VWSAAEPSPAPSGSPRCGRGPTGRACAARISSLHGACVAGDAARPDQHLLAFLRQALEAGAALHQHDPELILQLLDRADSVGCVMPRSSAARPKCRLLARAMKNSSLSIMKATVFQFAVSRKRGNSTKTRYDIDVVMICSIVLPMRIVRLKPYSRAMERMDIDEDAMRRIELGIATAPEAHPMMKGLKGARKARFSLPGRGKSGGGRVIYYLLVGQAMYLMTAYPKNEREDLSSDQRKAILNVIEDLKRFRT